MSTKFDDPSYLHAWATGNKFPEIHSNMAFAAGEYLQAGRVLDLCCSYGLLGARLSKFYPEKFPYVVGLDGDKRVVEASHAAGLVDGPSALLDDLQFFQLFPETFQTFVEYIKHHEIDTIVARRAFPELFSNEMGKGHEFGQLFAKTMHELGVKQILIEGRVYSPRSNNSLSKLENEVALFTEYYDAEYLPIPNIALLRARQGLVTY